MCRDMGRYCISKSYILETIDGSIAIGEDVVCRGVAFDSREVRDGDLFVALPGSKTHGHRFVKNALLSGARLAIVEDADFLKDGVLNGRVVVVPSTQEAFEELARRQRANIPAPIVCITGTVGKTTTKEITAAILSLLGRGFYSKKSYNSNIGVPYTILNAETNPKWGVIECGMNAPGELREISAITQPNVVAITELTPVHMEMFSDLYELGMAKCELLEGLKDNGIVIYNSDNDVLEECIQGAISLVRRVKRGVSLRTFGTREGADVRLLDYKGLGTEGSEYIFDIGDGQRIRVKTPLLGEHNGMNMACAICIALSMQNFVGRRIDVSLLASVLGNISPPPLRLNIKRLDGGRIALDDTYNSSPSAVAKAVKIAEELAGDGSYGIVLGDMLEMGDKSEEIHRSVAKVILEGKKPAFVYTVGKYSYFISDEMAKNGIETKHFDKVDDLVSCIGILPTVRVYLFKGSRGVALNRAVDALVEGNLRTAI